VNCGPNLEGEGGGKAGGKAGTWPAQWSIADVAPIVVSHFDQRARGSAASSSGDLRTG